MEIEKESQENIEKQEEYYDFHPIIQIIQEELDKQSLEILNEYYKLNLKPKKLVFYKPPQMDCKHRTKDFKKIRSK